MAALAENDRLTGPFVAVAGQVDFPADFPLIEGPDDPLGSCAVVVRLRAGSRVELTHAQFTVPAASDNGFTARLNVPAQAGDTYWIMGRQRQARARAHVPNGAIRTPTLESDAREAAAKAQEAARDLALTMRVPVGEVPPSPQQIVEAVEIATVKLNKATVNALTDSFYGVGDGVMDDTAAVQAANAAGGVVYVPEGRFETDLGFYDLLNARFTGEGQVVLDGYAQARDRSFMTSEIADVSYDRQRIFDGDWSKAHNVRYAFRGGSLGKTPTSSYRNLTLASPEITILDFTGGLNTDLIDHAGGRTGMTDRYRLLYHGGQGDLVGETFFGEVYSARSGAAHWLANPALIVQNGGLGAVGGATGAFLNHSEFIYSDSGLAVTAIDRVRNYNRTNAGASLHQVWAHDRPQSSGSIPVDVAYAPAGAWRRGFDTAAASFESGAWVATKRGDYRYMDATSTADPLGARFYSDDLGDTFDGIVGDAYTLALGAGVKWSVSGLSAHADDAAAGGGGLSIGNIYVNSATGALTYKRT